MPQTKTILSDGSIFKQSQDVGLAYVLRLDPDRLLAPCCQALGARTAALPYGGWESMQIKGHTLGHYLSALSQFVYATGSEDAEKKLKYTIGRIKKLQRGDGYFAGIPSAPFDKAFEGKVDADRFSLSGWWVPWYSVHKIYAGLIDAYTLAGNEDALRVVRGMADWAVRGTAGMTEEQFQRMLYCEHGGMCKVFADLYGITKDEKYLAMAKRFVHQEIMKSAMKGVDKLQGYHANTQLPKFLGAARLYELTGEEEYRKAVEFFFDTVVQTRSYATGGNSIGEHFGQQLQETLGRDTCETCNTYNMLELAGHVFDWTHHPGVADYYETALYNHILASQDPDSGAKTYFVSTLPGFFKVYCSDENAFWCCTGTGLENPARYGRFIISDDGDTLWVNLFIPAVVTTADGWKVQIDTAFPYEAAMKVRVLQCGSAPRKIKVRRPDWGKTSTYVTLSAAPHAGDVFDAALPMTLHTRRTRDKSGNFSVFYGPLLLASDMGRDGMPRDKVDNHLVYMNEAARPVAPITANVLSPAEWVKSEREPLHFVTDGAASQDGTVHHLRPFFDVHHTRYTVYFNDGRGKVDAREERYSSSTVDKVEPGRQQSEVEHHAKSQSTTMGYIDTVDRNFRSLQKGSTLSYRVKTASNGKIIVTTYGADSGTLRVAVDGADVASIVQDGSAGETLLDSEVEMGGGGTQRKVRTVSVACDDGVVHLLELRILKAEE